MKLSCLPVSLYQDLSAGRRTLADWFAFAAALGLDAADVSVAHLTDRRPHSLAALRRQAAAAGLEVAMLVAYCDFTHPDANVRRRQVDELRTHIEAAALLGAQLVRVTAGQAHPGIERQAATAWAADGLTACVDEAAAAGVTLAFENHTIGYGWTYMDFARPAEIFLEIVRRTDGSGLAILFDTANTLGAGDDPLAVLEAVLPRIAMLHVNDIRRAGHFEPVVVGSGVAPLASIFRRLRAAGYDGWISVEEASHNGEEGFRRAIPACRRLWDGAAPQPAPS